MMNTPNLFRYVLFLCMMFLVSMLFYYTPSVAATNAESDPPLHDCDRLAASPFDTARRTEGVSDKDMQPEQAVKACLQAVTSFPTVPRFQYQYARALYKAGRLNEAADFCQQASSLYPPAMTCMGVFYLRAGRAKDFRGFPQNYEKAAAWFRRGAEEGDPYSKMYLGTLYRDGTGVSRNMSMAGRYYAESLPLLEDLAEGGDVRAQETIGWIHEAGVGSEKNIAIARTWYEKAASGGSVYARDALKRGELIATQGTPEADISSEESSAITGGEKGALDVHPRSHFQVASCNWGGYPIFFPEDESEKILNATQKYYVVAWVLDPIAVTDRNTIFDIFSQALRAAKDKCKNRQTLAEVHLIYWREEYRNWASSNLLVRNVQETHFAWGYTSDSGEVLFYNNPQATTAERQSSVLAFLKRANVDARVDMRDLGANPFVYEGKVVLIEPIFERMLSKSEALFVFAWGNGIFFIVSDVPTSGFTQQTKVLLAARVLGNKETKTPAGGETLLPHLKYIDAFSGKYTENDLKWAMNQLKAE